MTRLALLLLVVAAPSVAAPVPKELKKVPELFPTAVGTSWVYVNQKTGQPDHAREVIECAVNDDGSRTARIQWTTHGGPYSDGPTDYRVDARTVAWVGEVDGRVRARPYILFRGDAKPGERWDAGMEPAPPPGGKPAITSVQDEPEDVVTPAGTFRAVRVRCTYGNMEAWYARGVGLVKWDHGGGTVVVLSKFTPGKDAKR